VNKTQTNVKRIGSFPIGSCLNRTTRNLERRREHLRGVLQPSRGPSSYTRTTQDSTPVLQPCSFSSNTPSLNIFPTLPLILRYSRYTWTCQLNAIMWNWGIAAKALLPLDLLLKVLCSPPLCVTLHPKYCLSMLHIHYTMLGVVGSK
jgi:hypothetical protein